MPRGISNAAQRHVSSHATAQADVHSRFVVLLLQTRHAASGLFGFLSARITIAVQQDRLPRPTAAVAGYACRPGPPALGRVAVGRAARDQFPHPRVGDRHNKPRRQAARWACHPINGKPPASQGNKPTIVQSVPKIITRSLDKLDAAKDPLRNTYQQ
jgi:hypothetical protein